MIPPRREQLRGRDAVYRFHHETMFRTLPDVKIKLIDGPYLALDGTGISGAAADQRNDDRAAGAAGALPRLAGRSCSKPPSFRGLKTACWRATPLSSICLGWRGRLVLSLPLVGWANGSDCGGSTWPRSQPGETHRPMTGTPSSNGGKRRMGRWRNAGLAIIGGLAAVAATVAVLGNRAAEQRRSDLAAEHSLAQTRHGQIEYISWGEGPPVLVLHGAGGGFDQGRLLAETLGGSGSRFVAVSRFGYLGSELPADPSTAAQAEAFRDLLDHLGIERASILAMSGGVPPALKFAEMFPDRTDRLALLSPSLFTPFSPVVEDRPISCLGLYHPARQ